MAIFLGTASWNNLPDVYVPKNMATKNYQGIRFENQVVTSVHDSLTLEAPLQITINDSPFTLSMRTPGADAELVRGLLHSEDIISHPEFHPHVDFVSGEPEQIISEVRLSIPESYLGKGYSNSRSLLSVSSCGICGKTTLDEVHKELTSVRGGFQLSADQIAAMFKEMHTNQRDFKQSGGTHAAAAFDVSGDLLGVREDIGRHNAVDKIVGHLLLTNNLPRAMAMAVSGRISYEIVIKVFKAGVPVLAAVSAPSTLAVDYAKELGITIFGFCREGRVTCYAHPERIVSTRYQVSP